jgi:hypothetical protein
MVTVTVVVPDVIVVDVDLDVGVDLDVDVDLGVDVDVDVDLDLDLDLDLGLDLALGVGAGVDAGVGVAAVVAVPLERLQQWPETEPGAANGRIAVSADDRGRDSKGPMEPYGTWRETASRSAMVWWIWCASAFKTSNVVYSLKQARASRSETQRKMGRANMPRRQGAKVPRGAPNPGLVQGRGCLLLPFHSFGF